MTKFHIEDGELKFAIDLDKTETMRVPDDVTIIGKGAFSGNKTMKEVIIPPSVKIIKRHAFKDCFELTKLIIPSTVEKVEEEAFIGCVKLEEISCDLEKTEFEKNVFSYCVALKTLIANNDIARIFYFPLENQFVISKYRSTVPGGGIKIYTGKFAGEVFPTLKPREKSSLFYFATLIYNNKEYMWYSKYLEQAVNGVLYAAKEQTIVKHFGGPISRETIISPEDFGIMTGICSQGIEIWLKKIGKDWSWRAPLGTVLDMLKKDIPGAYRRGEYVLEHQNTPLHLQRLDRGLTIEEAIYTDEKDNK